MERKAKRSAPAHLVAHDPTSREEKLSGPGATVPMSETNPATGEAEPQHSPRERLATARVHGQPDITKSLALSPRDNAN